MFVRFERKTVFKITVQEINTLSRCHNGPCYAALGLSRADCLQTIAIRWLETVFSTFQDLQFDGSLKPLYIG